MLQAPSAYPLAGVALCLSNVTHRGLDDPRLNNDSFELGRANLLEHRLSADILNSPQLLVCLDFERPSLPRDLYDPATRKLRSETDFESLIDDLVVSQLGAGYRTVKLSQLRLSIAVILRELLENTDDHAKTDSEGGHSGRRIRNRLELVCSRTLT